MKLEDQVVSLELSKRLKELGVKQDSLYYWTDHLDWKLRTDQGFSDQWNSAFTVAELGMMLPSKITAFGQIHHFLRTWKRIAGEFGVRYKPNFGPAYIPAKIAKTEADARAKCLIYLLENDLMKL